MIDKTAEMEERFARLEERLKLVFAEIEKRLDSVQVKPEYSVEERIQEIEDLLLLLQLETTKLKEKIGEGLDFGIAASVPDLESRLMRLEEEMASKTGQIAESGPDTRMEKIEKQLSEIKDTHVKVDAHTEHALKTALKEEFSKDVKDLEKRVNTLEALLEKRGRREIEDADSDSSDVLASIQKILKG
jgi:hypothetical protein